MHIYFLTRGIQHRVDLWKAHMQLQVFVANRRNLKTNQIDAIPIQGALRPIQLWEYVFPEESLQDVMTMLQVDNQHYTKSSWGVPELKLKALRKMLGTKEEKVLPLPDLPPLPVEQKRDVDRRGVAIYPIGIKRDVRKEMPEWGYEMEML